jgi:cell division protein FtsL
MNKVNNQRIFLTIIGVIFIGLCVFFAIECATSGSEIAKLTDVQEELTKQKKDLTSKLVEVNSLNVIKEKAPSLGFSDPKKVVYIQKTDEFASLLR